MLRGTVSLPYGCALSDSSKDSERLPSRQQQHLPGTHDPEKIKVRFSQPALKALTDIAASVRFSAYDPDGYVILEGIAAGKPQQLWLIMAFMSSLARDVQEHGNAKSLKAYHDFSRALREDDGFLLMEGRRRLDPKQLTVRFSDIMREHMKDLAAAVHFDDGFNQDARETLRQWTQPKAFSLWEVVTSLPVVMKEAAACVEEKAPDATHGVVSQFGEFNRYTIRDSAIREHRR